MLKSHAVFVLETLVLASTHYVIKSQKHIPNRGLVEDVFHAKKNLPRLFMADLMRFSAGALLTGLLQEVTAVIYVCVHI